MTTELVESVAPPQAERFEEAGTTLVHQSFDSGEGSMARRVGGHVRRARHAGVGGTTGLCRPSWPLRDRDHSVSSPRSPMIAVTTYPQRVRRLMQRVSSAVQVSHDRDAVGGDVVLRVPGEAVGPVQADVNDRSPGVVTEAEGGVVLAGHEVRQRVAEPVAEPVLALHLERLVAADLERASRPREELAIAVTPHRGRHRRHPSGPTRPVN